MNQTLFCRGIRQKAVLAAVASMGLVAAMSNEAMAASFGFEYTFLSGSGAGDSIVGTLEGTEVNPGFVSDLTGLNAEFRGTSFSGTPVGGSFFTLNDAPTQQFFINLQPTPTTPLLTLSSATGTGALVGAIPGSPFFGPPTIGAGVFSAPNPNNPTEIPTPALLPGLIACGVGALKRRRKLASQVALQGSDTAA